MDCATEDAAPTGARSQWLQHALIVTQTALAVVLLTCGGLLLQTFQHLRNTDLGMQTEKLLTFETPLFRYGDNEKRIAFVNAQLDAIRAIPGVVNAGATSQIPLKNMDAQADVLLAAGQTKDQVKGQVALMRTVTHDTCRRSARVSARAVSSRARTGVPSRQWPSSTSPSPTGTFLDARRLARSSNTETSATKATGTPSSAS